MREQTAAMLREAEHGQSIVETVLMMPVLIFLLLNTLNFGYFFLTLVNLTATPRTGAEYSVMGSSTTAAKSLPTAGDTWPPTSAKTVAYLLYWDMTGAMYAPATLAAVRVCSPSIIVGGSGYDSNGLSNCAQYGNAPAGYSWPQRAASACAPPVGSACGKDPNSSFTMAQVDVAYRYTPIIPASVANVFLASLSVCQSQNGATGCTFTRTTKMRTMGY